MKRISMLSLALAAVLLLGGCTNISDRIIVVGGTQQVDEDYEPGVGGDLLIPDPFGNRDEQQFVDDYTSYAFSPQQESFIASCLFMGDSICSGFGAYGFAQSCYAKAGVAARNILEFTFDYSGYQVGPLTTLVNSGSKNLVFLMGTNDVNMVSAKEYAEYYDDFLSKVEASCRDVSIYVVSVPPVTEDSDFCYNYQLDELNSELKSMIEGSTAIRHYIDAAALLKDDDGALKDIYSAGDGVHLSRAAYYAVLYALCSGAGVQ